jgi:hypothetical protein
MDPKAEALREHLLAQQPPPPDRLAAYRDEVRAMLQRNDKRLRWEKWGASLLWVFTVFLGTGFLLLFADTMHGGIWACFLALLLLVSAAVELLKHFINRSRVEVLKELKAVQVQLLELQEALHGRDGGAPSRETGSAGQAPRLPAL